MRSVDAEVIEIAFDSVHHVRHLRWMALYRRSAVMAKESQGMDIVMCGHEWDHVLPDAARAGHTVQQHQVRRR